MSWLNHIWTFPYDPVNQPSIRSSRRHSSATSTSGRPTRAQHNNYGRIGHDSKTASPVSAENDSASANLPHFRTHFGSTLYWHPWYDAGGDDHDLSSSLGRSLSAHQLHPYRLQGDVEVDEIFQLLQSEGRPVRPGQDLLAMAQEQFHAIAAFNNNFKDDELQNGSKKFSAANIALAKFYRKYNFDPSLKVIATTTRSTGSDSSSFSLTPLPSWVNVEQLQRGQTVFCAYMPAILLSLFYRSLIPGFSLPPLAAVVQSTGYLSARRRKVVTDGSVKNRLQDTFAFVASCFLDGSINLNGTACSQQEGVSTNVAQVACILPGGEGWKAALQVRFLHAKVRHALLHNARRPWDTEQWGIPINQEDMAATLLAFSINSLLGLEMILLGLPLLPEQERIDFVALWRYLGWLLGIPVLEDDTAVHSHHHVTPNGDMGPLLPLDPCGPGWIPSRPNSLEHSLNLLFSISVHLMHPDQSSVQTAHYLCRNAGKTPEDKVNKDEKSRHSNNGEEVQEDNWFYFRALQCRRFVGHELADALQLPYHPTFWGRIQMWTYSTLYLSILTVYTAAALPYIPFFRKRMIRFHTNILNRFVANWKESHPKRMREQLEQNKSAVNSNETGGHGSTITVTNATPSVCPFAMVAPPFQEE